MVLAKWEPPDQPKHFRIVCGHVVETPHDGRPDLVIKAQRHTTDPRREDNLSQPIQPSPRICTGGATWRS
jgi:hypothetical protein